MKFIFTDIGNGTHVTTYIHWHTVSELEMINSSSNIVASDNFTCAKSVNASSKTESVFNKERSHCKYLKKQLIIFKQFIITRVINGKHHMIII